MSGDGAAGVAAKADLETVKSAPARRRRARRLRGD